MKKQPLVSIVVPVYNAEKFLADTIESVQAQTYGSWELLLVDDCSNDKSVTIIKKYQKDDKRIKLIRMVQNSGAALSRNAGVNKCKGRFIAFLDADDLWHPEKIARQISFMLQNEIAFSFTGYEFADQDGVPNGKKVYVPASLTYRQALKNTTISTIATMFDMTKLAKASISMPNIKSEDTATWWNILRQGHTAYGLNEILSFYRRSSNTQSANKFTATKQTWRLYREHQNFNFVISFYYFCWYLFNAVRRRI